MISREGSTPPIAEISSAEQETALLLVTYGWITNCPELWVFHLPLIGIQPTSEMLNRKRLTIEDALALRTLPHVVGTDGTLRHLNERFRVGDVSVKYNGRKVSGAFIAGATEQVGVVSEFEAKKGRFWTEAENQRHAHVCVLGNDTAEQLFGEKDPIGEGVNVATGLFTVIGVVDKRKQPFGSGKNPADNGVYFPLTTFHTLYPELKDMYIGVKYDDPRNKSLVEEEVRETLRVRRKLKVNQPDNLKYSGQNP